MTGEEWAILTGQSKKNALGTPEEFEAWLATDQTIPLQEWLTMRRQLRRSDDLAEALKTVKTTQTVPVVRYEGDRRVVIGTAEVEVVDGNYHATFELNSDSISKHYGILGPFSIGEAR